MVLRDSLPAFGFDVVGDASNGAEAGDKVAELKPEVVLLDLRMPGVDGMEATVLIEARNRRPGGRSSRHTLSREFPDGPRSSWAPRPCWRRTPPLDVLVDTLRAAAHVYRASSADDDV